MPDSYVVGLPGIRSAKTATNKIIFRQGDWLSGLALGKIIDGVNSRDPTNTGQVDVLQPGLLLGKITTGGLYAPSILGTLTVAFTAGGTSMTVAAATATELVRRVGSSGTFKLTGPPAAAGVLNTQTITYSAVNTTTGVITVTDPAVSYILGSFVQPTDGSENALTFVNEGYGIQVTDTDHSTNLSVQMPNVAIAGVITSSQLVNWPSDTSLQSWVITHLNAAAGGQFVFDSPRY